MIPKRISWILILILVGILVFSMPGQAQQPTNPGQVPKPGQTPTQPPPGQSAAERRPPAPEYAIALLSTFLVLVIVCMPSRKG